MQNGCDGKELRPSAAERTFLQVILIRFVGKHVCHCRAASWEGEGADVCSKLLVCRCSPAGVWVYKVALQTTWLHM